MKKACQSGGLRIAPSAIVAQAPPDLQGWGPYQFPRVERLADGALHVVFHLHADSATAYGLPNGHALSQDEGQSWQELITPPSSPGGLLLPNGDRLLADTARSLPVRDLVLPPPLASIHASYADYNFYAVEDLPTNLRPAWPFRRWPKQGVRREQEWATVHFKAVPDVRVQTESVFVVPFFEHDRIRLTSGGTLRATLYAMPHLGHRRRVIRPFLTTIVHSTDNGRSWHEISVIPYRPDMKADPLWDQRDGFSEPQINEMPDGTLLALMRTDDGNGVGPLYAAQSRDNGLTWSTPWVFDDRGVWPQILTLRCGVTLAAYGRPGLFLRATRDPSGKVWSERISLVEPSDRSHPNTCSYCGLMALDDRRALVVYSDFHYPNRERRPCKTILSRLIEAE